MELFSRVRPATPEDENKFPRRSYSMLDTMCQCSYRFKTKYIDKEYSDKSTIALELGSLAHRVLELKGNFILNNKEVNYDFLQQVLYNGDSEVAGLDLIKHKYTEDYYTPDTNGITYDTKIHRFTEDVMSTRCENSGYEIIGTEIPFTFIYDDKVLINGFIDRLDKNLTTGNYKVIDYKTSKNVFSAVKIKTPMQMFIYDLAVYSMYGVVPTEHEYDFIFLDKKQDEFSGVCTSGYIKRGFKKLDGWLERIDEMASTNIYPPSPSPLCYWCEYCGNTPNSDPKLNDLCTYYSFWTPTHKTYEVLNKFDPKADTKKSEDVRKFIF